MSMKNTNDVRLRRRHAAVIGLALAAPLAWACAGSEEDHSATGEPSERIDAGHVPSAGDDAAASGDASTNDGDAGLKDARDGNAGQDADSAEDASDAQDPNRIVQIATGGTSTTCAVTAAGAVYCWGDNGYGQLGVSSVTMEFSLTPKAVAGVADAVEVSVGSAHVCARRASGSVVCWGDNSGGQHGDGTFGKGPGTNPEATAVSGLTDAVEIAAGAEHTCARRASGTVVCWGSNYLGALGDGTTVWASPTVVTVVGLDDAVQIAAGRFVTCARRAAGTVVCWGFNGNSQIGDGTTTDRPTPVAVLGLTDAVDVRTAPGWTFDGVYTVCARRASGAAVCWGDNFYGQLGDGTTTASSTPVTVADLTNAVEVVPGLHTCARQASGAVLCWGRNDTGEIGDGTTTPRLAPVSVSGLTDAVEISAGQYHTCARRASGTIVCWGNNDYGQLGDGSMTQRLTPTAVTGLP